MRKLLVFIIFFSAIVSGKEKIAFAEPSAVQVGNPEFSYLLNHLTIEAESPLPYKLPPDSKFAYRILGVTQQGSCVEGCPPSTIYVATSNYSDHRDGDIKLCQINGLRFYSNIRIIDFKPAATSGPFLVFEVRSNPDPRVRRLYVVTVSQDSCTVKFSGEHKRGI